MEIRVEGLIESATCEVALISSGTVFERSHYMVINPAKGDVICSRSYAGVLSRSPVYFFNGEAWTEMTERVIGRSLELLSHETARRLVQAHLAGTWDGEIAAIKQEEVAAREKRMRNDLASEKSLNESRREEISRLKTIIEQIYLINEAAGPGSRKKLRELVVPEVWICDRCGSTISGCDCE